MRLLARIGITASLAAGIVMVMTTGRTPGAPPEEALVARDNPLQPDLDLHGVVIPPAPPLSAEDELKTFKLQDGFRVELAAADPQVEDPVSIAFGPDGRMWVVEMRDYMPHADGAGEDEPLGRIRVLEDTHGDGRFDKATVFLDGLVLPRAVALARNSVLVGEPPNLWLCKAGKDGTCAEKTLVSSNYGAAHGQPEHMINGMAYLMDNWFYNAGGVFRYRFQAGKWVEDTVETRGQWGVTQDDFGRIYTNDNSRILAVDLAPPHYLSRNPAFSTTEGIYAKCTTDETLFPSRPNPGVNRGYQPKVLCADGTLVKPTAACGPCVYRGDLFPPEFRGNVFACEPAGNLIKRYVIREEPGKVVATPAYVAAEFLTSTDERFRPVNVFNGPDGALYVVDMYRGLIQHKAYLTPYLKRNVEARGLEAPIHLGRIWRIVPPGKDAPRGVKMPTETADLVKCLAHPNGWRRDTAQRLLVERHDLDSVAALEKMSHAGPTPEARLHALWTLQGFARLAPDDVLAALADADSKVRAAAVRLAEPLLVPSTRKVYLPEVLKLAADDSYDVQLQLCLSLGGVDDPAADAAVAQLLRKNVSIPVVRAAVVSGLRGREADVLELLLHSPNWEKSVDGGDAVFGALARCIIAGHKAQPVVELLNTIARHPQGWRETACFRGIAETPPKKDAGRRPLKLIYLDAEPDALVALSSSGDARIRALATKAQSRLTWPGKRGYVAPPVPTPLTSYHQALFDRGQKLYTATCIACHQANGEGIDGLAPPLVDSEWVSGPNPRLIRIVLNGLNGPVKVDGTSINSEMPSWLKLKDDDIAGVLTYVRRGWEFMGDPIDPKEVAAIRVETKDRHDAWTAKELAQVK